MYFQHFYNEVAGSMFARSTIQTTYLNHKFQLSCLFVVMSLSISLLVRTFHYSTLIQASESASYLSW